MERQRNQKINETLWESEDPSTQASMAVAVKLLCTITLWTLIAKYAFHVTRSFSIKNFVAYNLASSCASILYSAIYRLQTGVQNPSEIDKSGKRTASHPINSLLGVIENLAAFFVTNYIMQAMNIDVVAFFSINAFIHLAIFLVINIAINKALNYIVSFVDRKLEKNCLERENNAGLANGEQELVNMTNSNNHRYNASDNEARSNYSPSGIIDNVKIGSDVGVSFSATVGAQ